MISSGYQVGSRLEATRSNTRDIKGEERESMCEVSQTELGNHKPRKISSLLSTNKRQT